MANPSSFPSGFAHGVSIRGLPILNSYPNKVFYVSSTVGSNGNRGTFERPFATLSYAVSQCTASKGDVIVLMPGHAETVTSAGGIALNVAGISVTTQGKGGLRPRFTFTTSTAASITISANDVSLEGVDLVAGIDGLTKPLDVTGDGVYINIRGRDTDNSTQAARYILLTGVDRSTVIFKHGGNQVGGTTVNAIRLVNCKDVRIELDAYGQVTTGWVEFITTASVNVTIQGRTYTSGTTDGSKNVVDTVGGSTWQATLTDGTSGSTWTGGSAGSLGTLYPLVGYRVTKSENVNTATGVDLFTVTGKVLITLWTGEVTDALNASPTDYKIRVKTDNVDLCAASNIASAAVGFLFQMCGDAGDTLINTASATNTADNNGKGMAQRVVGKTGGTCVLQSNRTAGAAGDTIVHSVYYIPLEPGATVVAA